jgi:hypothetical protein
MRRLDDAVDTPIAGLTGLASGRGRPISSPALAPLLGLGRARPGGDAAVARPWSSATARAKLEP